jgi:hypothetical protein
MDGKELVAWILPSIIGCVGSNNSGTLVDAGFDQPLDAAAPDAQESAIADAPADVVSPIDTDAPADVVSPIDTDAPADVVSPIDIAAPANSCELPTGLTFSANQTFQVTGSIASYSDSYHLDNTGLLITRNWWNGYDAEIERTCTPVLPACGLPDQITVGNISADLAAPDVKPALAAPPYTTFGAVKWPSDAWYIAEDGGAGPIVVGLPCTDADAGPCQPIPAGLERLKGDLQGLVAAGAAQAACVDLLKP